MESEEVAMQRDLGEGLVLRRATAADTEALAAFNAAIFGDPGAPNEGSADWTRDLMGGDHPTCAGDFTLVEDSRSDKIVSSLVLIGQTWSYDGIEFGVGRTELVGTHPEYRRRGLIRAQFAVLHAWSAARGHTLQAMHGIPGFYRQFGYEMALELDGCRHGYPQLVPELKEGQAEPYHVRPATEADLPFIAPVYREATRRDRVACVRDLAGWRYELRGRRERETRRVELRVVESAAGEPVGFLVHAWRNWGDTLVTMVYELKRGASWLAVTPSVLRYLKATGAAYAADGAREPEGPFSALELDLGTDHPAYHAASDCLPRTGRPYAWYVRVPDLPDFLRHIAPALERRLEPSALAGHTGELWISFYREGLCLALERGRLAKVERWVTEPAKPATAFFPDLTFLQLLLGYRSLQELEYAFADCRVEDDEARALLMALFPSQTSNVWGVS